VVDKNGYILTNNHVVDKSDRIQVKFTHDSHLYDAKVIGTDLATDLAVIKVEGKSNLVAAKVGNSDAVQVGDWAMAIGSPFGFQTTVTAGIISAKEREIPGDSSQFQHFLQTDAAINPGNSGGPLLNIRGEVIGINTAIISRSGGFQGLGFALPVNTAAGVYNDIIKNGKVTRGSIGITFTQPDSEQGRALLKANGVDEGIFVQSVVPGGPADKAGLRDGDIIVAINGKPIREGNELVGTVTATPVGGSLNLTVMHERKRENYKVVVGDLAQLFPDKFGGPSESAHNDAHGDAASFGMYVQTLTDRQRQSMNLRQAGGVLITQVEPDSFAADVGLHEGDVLVSINSQPVNSREDVVHIRGTLKPGAAVAFRVMSRGASRSGEWTSAFLAGTMPSNAK
jgi:serine protease Do